MHIIKEEFEARFSVDYTSGCWLWNLAPNGRGRPQFFVRELDDQICASIAAYWLYKGEVPIGMSVLHTCDVPMCVNPDHLFLGTQADNIADMIAKGRKVILQGPQAPTAKLTAGMVKEIRESPQYIGSMLKLARKYGVSKSTIRKVLHGRTYTSVV